MWRLPRRSWRIPTYPCRWWPHCWGYVMTRRHNKRCQGEGLEDIVRRRCGQYEKDISPLCQDIIWMTLEETQGKSHRKITMATSIILMEKLLSLHWNPGVFLNQLVRGNIHRIPVKLWKHRKLKVGGRPDPRLYVNRWSSTRCRIFGSEKASIRPLKLARLCHEACSVVAEGTVSWLPKWCCQKTANSRMWIGKRTNTGVDNKTRCL